MAAIDNSKSVAKEQTLPVSQDVYDLLQGASERFSELQRQAETRGADSADRLSALHSAARLIENLPDRLSPLTHALDHAAAEEIASKVARFAGSAERAMKQPDNDFGLSVLLVPMGSRIGEPNQLEALVLRLSVESNLSQHTLKLDVSTPLLDPSQSELNFDEDGFYHIELPESFEWISGADFHEDDLKDRVVRITFRDGFQSDLGDDDMASSLDDHLQRLEGVADVYWEDREYFHITYKPGQDLTQLMLNIEQLMALSNDAEK